VRFSVTFNTAVGSFVCEAARPPFQATTQTPTSQAGPATTAEAIYHIIFPHIIMSISITFSGRAMKIRMLSIDWKPLLYPIINISITLPVRKKEIWMLTVGNESLVYNLINISIIFPAPDMQMQMLMINWVLYDLPPTPQARSRA
jgi:hypothetical protein